jgi:hypothetical protein
MSVRCGTHLTFRIGSLKKDENSEIQKKNQNTFVLRDAIDKNLMLLRREREDHADTVPRGLAKFIETYQY